MVLVTFRNSNDNLTSMFMTKFASVKAAKDAIEHDAAFFADAHMVTSKSGVEMKFKQHSKWVNPKSEDYYEVQGQDGVKCVWQYFKIG